MGLEEVYTNYKVLRVIPPTGYDTEETDIPVMVKIGRSAGPYRDDTSDVFTKLGASYQKMAISLDDGVTECPVEVKDWDVTRQLGILFVKIPSVPTTGMTLKLWYDPTHADNPNVGAVGSAAGQSVWSNGFAVVWHKPSGGLLLDSTANANHGTIYGATPTQGPLGACYSYDGVDDQALTANPVDLAGGFTCEFFARTPAPHYGALGGNNQFAARIEPLNEHPDRLAGFLKKSDGTLIERSTIPYITGGGSIFHAVWTWDKTTFASYGNGNHTDSVSANVALSTPTVFNIAGFNMVAPFGKYDIYLATVSSIARSPAWIALTNASLKDELIAFSEPGTESLSGTERMRLTPDGTLIANEFVEV